MQNLYIFLTLLTVVPTDAGKEIVFATYVDYLTHIPDILVRMNLPQNSTLSVAQEDIAAASEYTLLMSPAEKGYLFNSLKKAKRYWEYGTGGSTKMACEINPDLNIQAVESDYNIVMHLHTENECIRNAVGNRLRFYLIDIGVVGAWGYPVNQSHASNFGVER